MLNNGGYNDALGIEPTPKSSINDPRLLDMSVFEHQVSLLIPFILNHSIKLRI